MMKLERRLRKRLAVGSVTEGEIVVLSNESQDIQSFDS